MDPGGTYKMLHEQQYRRVNDCSTNMLPEIAQSQQTHMKHRIRRDICGLWSRHSLQEYSKLSAAENGRQQQFNMFCVKDKNEKTPCDLRQWVWGHIHRLTKSTKFKWQACRLHTPASRLTLWRDNITKTKLHSSTVLQPGPGYNISEWSQSNDSNLV